jgi:hypothetical protein
MVSAWQADTKDTLPPDATDIFCSSVWLTDTALRLSTEHVQFCDILSVDVQNSNIPFDGKPILLEGDLRLVLPIVQGVVHSEIIRASLLSSCLWDHFTVMRLTVNMRLVRPGKTDQMRSSIATFARWVLGVREGTVNCPFTLGDTHRVGIQVLSRYLINGKGSKMIAITEAIYDDFDNQYSSMAYLAARFGCLPHKFCR